MTKPEPIATLSMDEVKHLEDLRRNFKAQHCVIGHALKELLDQQIALHTEGEKAINEYMDGLAKKYDFHELDDYVIDRWTGEVMPYTDDEAEQHISSRSTR